MRKTALKTAALAFALATLSSPALAAEDARGRELVNSLGCKGCHKIGGSGGAVGPALDGVGKRLSAEQIQKKIVDPKSVNPKSTMPSYKHLPPADIKALVGYLAAQK